MWGNQQQPQVDRLPNWDINKLSQSDSSPRYFGAFGVGSPATHMNHNLEQYSEQASGYDEMYKRAQEQGFLPRLLIIDQNYLDRFERPRGQQVRGVLTGKMR